MLTFIFIVGQIAQIALFIYLYNRSEGYKEKNDKILHNINHYGEYLETDFPIVGDLCKELVETQDGYCHFSGEIFLDDMLEKYVDSKES